jgi:HrpA-like RNA helicase
MKTNPTINDGVLSDTSAEQLLGGGPALQDLGVRAVETSDQELTLGNPELPIHDFRGQIVAAVNESQATIITAETGAGKSTQVPQFLAEQGYKVVVTQPRIVAARSLAERVREEVVATHGSDFADFVGYRTARERDDSPHNSILFATDGLQLVRELSGNGVGEKQVLVLDEVHEWNENMEVLVAWARQHMAEDPNFKVVVMSATMESGKLAEYFTQGDEREAPVIEVPGRTFEVKRSEGGDVVGEAVEMARAGKNTLVFVPGKVEIAEVIAEIERANIPGVTILPLHGQLEAAEQRKIFQKHSGVKVVVATNVAQTSITIDDIDAVVDSGLERRNEVKNGVEGLYLRPISQADCLQRSGRAGRTKEGEYVLAQLGNREPVPFDEREAYGTPEIVRTRLDGMVLRLAKNGFDAEALDFYHQPPRSEIAEAKSRLQKLGALTKNDEITQIGRSMERMPLESHYARMMVEARKYGKEVQQQMAATLAMLEVGGAALRGRNNKRGWERLISSDKRSDLLVELEVFIASQKLSMQEQREHDIMVKNIGKAREILRQLQHAEKLSRQDEITAPTAEQRDQLIKCIIAGMVDHVCIYDRYSGLYRNGGSTERELSNRSVVSGSEMLVGDPFDLQIHGRRGDLVLRVIQNITQIPSIEVLREVAPQLFVEAPVGFKLVDGEVREINAAQFNGENIGEYVTSNIAPPSIGLRDWLVDLVYHNRTYPKIKALFELNEEAAKLQNLSGKPIPKIDIIGLLKSQPESVSTPDEMDANLPILTIADIIPQGEIDQIMADSPSEYIGMDIFYERGIPYVSRLSQETIASLPDEALQLPDGREIYYGGQFGSSQLLREKREAILEAIAQEKIHQAAVKAEQERIAHEEQEKRERLRQEQIAREARERAEQELLVLARQEARVLRDKANGLMDSDGDDISDDVYYDLEDALNGYPEGVTSREAIIAWSNNMARLIDLADTEIQRAKEETTVASADQIKALMDHFNKY